MKRSRNAFQNFTRETIGALLELSLGLSAWKSILEARGFADEPSSGNLHPTEAYLILPALPGVTAGIFHYNSYLHALEPRAEVPETLWQANQTASSLGWIPRRLDSIFWREAWKYGERAFRYCQQRRWTCLGALSFSANLLGWKVTWLNAVSDEEIARLLGFDQTQLAGVSSWSIPSCCFVHRSGEQRIPPDLPSEIVSEFSGLAFKERQIKLSEDHVDWEIISRVAEATAKTQVLAGTLAARGRPGLPDTTRPFYAPTAQSGILPHKSFAKEEARWPSMGSAASPKTSFAPCWTKPFPVTPARLSISD